MPGYLEEFTVGEVERFGRYEVTREEVMEFAERFDPQPYHLDDEAAAAHPIFGRISASGWHTTAMTMRMLVDHNESRNRQALGSPGIDELRWLKPVFPGDTLRVETEVLEVRRFRSRPEMGAVRTRLTVFNQHDEAVMQQLANGLYPTRQADG